MAPLPPLTPTPPESTGARVPARTRSEFSDDALRQSSASLIFVKLRKMIASDTQPTETILGAIAVAAHSLTGATGAAVAMPRDGAVVCVGRSGDTAPELGARLNVDSGISGECLRTGVTMRCDDASRDFHVDAEVCRQLGLQSIAVVPCAGSTAEWECWKPSRPSPTPSPKPGWRFWGGWPDWPKPPGPEAQSRKRRSVEKSVGRNQRPSLHCGRSPCGTTSAGRPRRRFRWPRCEKHWPAQPQESRFSEKMDLCVLAAVALLAVILLSVYGWRAWYRSSVASTASRSIASSSAASPEDASATPGAAATVDIVRRSSRTRRQRLRWRRPSAMRRARRGGECGNAIRAGS